MARNERADWNFAAYLLQEKAPAWPDKTAARCRGRSLTYARLSELSFAMAGLFRSRGLLPGQAVLLILPDSFSFLASFLGCLLAGIVAAPLNTRLRRQDVADCLADIRPVLVLAPPGHEALDAAAEAGVPALPLDDDLLEEKAAGGAPPAAHPAAKDDICVYFVTSGTTGHPKVAPHRQEDFFLVARHTGDFMEHRHDDVVLASPKMCHCYGLFASLTLPLQAGATVVLDPDKPSPESTLDLFRQEGVTYFASVPVFFGMLLLAMDPSTRLDRVRCFFSAGEALPEALALAWRERVGRDIWQGYGSTEVMTFAIGQKGADAVLGAAGRVLHPFEAVVLCEDGKAAGPGVPGHLALRCPTVMPGYLNSPEWTRRTFTPDGLLLTGDMAVERDGVFTILGRMDDMFKVGGLWVSPAKVENALLSHPAVAQAAVTGGAAGAFTLVRAHVTPRPGFLPGPDLAQDLIRHARTELPDFMVPHDVVFRDALPLTASGKVQRFKLRQA